MHFFTFILNLSEVRCVLHILIESMEGSHSKKSFLKKYLEIKTLLKKSQFSKVLGQNATGNKVLSFRFPGFIFLKQYAWAANKVSGNKITIIKVPL